MRIFKPCQRQGTVGAVALSTAGHDAGIYCIITELDGEYAYIADGRGRRIDRPKKKKLKHLSLTDHSVPSDGIKDGKTDLTNREIRLFISEYHKAVEGK
ncbi:MAG: RNA-binding protein [Clostridia bacterium]|jgi:ribosomal protein L14E/L6E/L27E|nr:RNA-binding protein [Clostridia bacterium]